jgi:hypothetical protein
MKKPDPALPEVDPQLLYLNAPLVLGTLARMCQAAVETLETGTPTIGLKTSLGDASALIVKLIKP